MRHSVPRAAIAALMLWSAAAAAQDTPPPATTGQMQNVFNPAISLIGNFLGVAGSNAVEDLPSASMRESELGLQAVVDPYARADVFLSFGEEGVDLEEGILTFTSLPAGLLVKVGRMRVAFGKINTMHLHAMPWPDEPLPVVNLLGSDEGWIGSGVSVGKLLPLPGDTFSELTVQVFRGDSNGLFVATDHNDLAYSTHYRVFRDLSDSVNLDAGLSYGGGPNGTFAGAETRLGALDLTLRWKPLQRGNYRSAILRGELFTSRREQEGGTESASGWYFSGDYQLARRWWVGARVEASEHPENASLRDTGAAATLTFWPSEFSQLRAEVRRRRYADQITANQLLMQVQFIIGAHGAHPF